MDILKVKIGDYLLIRKTKDDKSDIVCQVLFVKKNIITSVQMTVRVSFPENLRGETFAFNTSQLKKTRIKLLGKSATLTALYG